MSAAGASPWRGRVYARLRMAAAPARGVLAAGVALASALSVVALLAGSPGAQAGGAPALPPDLVTLPLEDGDLAVTEEGGRTLLRLSTEIGNVGAGPLEIFPSQGSTGCDADPDPANDRAASQRMFADTNASGAFERGADAVAFERMFGCLRYHPVHDHWHTLNFARYELRREPTGRLVRSRRKVGFCVRDSRPGEGAPGDDPQGTYPFASTSSGGCDQAAVQGISPGWTDLYALSVPGQQLYVDGLRRGRYCLVSRADPLDLLAEANEDNNVQRLRIAMRPRQLDVRALEAPCRTAPASG